MGLCLLIKGWMPEAEIDINGSPFLCGMLVERAIMQKNISIKGDISLLCEADISILEPVSLHHALYAVCCHWLASWIGI